MKLVIFMFLFVNILSSVSVDGSNVNKSSDSYIFMTLNKHFSEKVFSGELKILSLSKNDSHFFEVDFHVNKNDKMIYIWDKENIETPTYVYRNFPIRISDIYIMLNFSPPEELKVYHESFLDCFNGMNAILEISMYRNEYVKIKFLNKNKGYFHCETRFNIRDINKTKLVSNIPKNKYKDYAHIINEFNKKNHIGIEKNHKLELKEKN